MPTQRQNPTRSSPKKKRSKRKATDSDGQEISTKKSRAGAESLSMSQQPTLDEDSSLLPRRSGRSGAGMGGRADQLERIGALLGAPARTNQPKGSTSLDSNVPVNPLAPEPLRKGRGSRAKKPPPPYSASDTVDPPAATPTKPRGKKAKVTKNALIPPSSLETADDRPSFHQCEAGTRFGFSQSIVPPGTEPDLQVLNNPYVAAARANVATTCLPAPITPANQISVPPLPSRTAIKYLPAAITVSAKQDFAPPVPSRSTSAARPSDTLFYQNLDPALHSVGDGHLGQSDGSDASSKGSDSGTTDDEEEVDEEVGWGASQGYHTAHPGFSKEVPPPRPEVTTALPTDFEFQYSRDEEDHTAERSLAVESGPSDDDTIQLAATEPKPDDVLVNHHKKNGRPRLPNPELLDLLRSSDTKDIEAKSTESKIPATTVKSSRSKESPEGPKPTQLGWYPPRWKTFLEDAKGDCRAQHAIENAFPTLADDLPISVTEALTSSLVEWLEGGKQVEAGLWPDHKPDMAKLLFEDLSTWRSDLKKLAVTIAPSMYNLIPPPEVAAPDRAAWVQNAATVLLEDSLFLRNGMDDLGKTNNAAHPTLREAAISFLYTGSYRVAHRRPEIFKKAIPLNSLALICTAYHCVLDGLSKNGNGKLFPKFSAKEYGSIYNSIIVLLDEVNRDPYHGPKLRRQLRHWAAEGWAESCKLDGRDTTKHNHLRVVLD
ncbi:hypothetical protein DEU56DRAFT_920304 [Suillus clintonianus]|uniref:uncharacterized protein n=1 Tax=Suillus clintonianus TaxID=1904413 RepID=UPI001B87069C|nr:uncharacterized protein DEU56DRAFT_920304 [Suillus clintonianus]KAG2109534.1 hypothetical protein DEU56DRAFT_920304 [Suillus clintonianus]